MITDPFGNVTRLGYDSAGNVVYQINYLDEMGRAKHELYDLSGRLVSVWLPAVDDAETTSTQLINPRWQYSYDANGNQLTQTDPKNRTTSFAYDEQGRRLSRTLPAVSDGNSLNLSPPRRHHGAKRH